MMFAIRRAVRGAARPAFLNFRNTRHFTAVTAQAVKQLREATGVSMGKCRDALAAEDGDLEKAKVWLQKKG